MVDRYGMLEFKTCPAGGRVYTETRMVPQKNGPWVKWEDYEALQKELDLERGYYTDPDPFQYG